MFNFNQQLNNIAIELQQDVSNKAIGLYIHIPFCRDHCTYCSFLTTNNQSIKNDFLKTIISRILSWGKLLKRPAVDTIYIGGGTPSILTINELKHIMLSIKQAFATNKLLEVTIEANPGTINIKWLTQAKLLGFNRISIGIQTLDNNLLKSIGRIHNSKTAIKSIYLAKKAGFTNISSDLLIGIPEQNLNNILLDVKVLINAGINHLSLYLLDLDKTCRLKQNIDSGKLCMPKEDDIANIFESLHFFLKDFGFHHYEISNYAYNNCESIHNNKYWLRHPYLGIGPSAASQIGLWRWSETSDINLWLNSYNNFFIQKLSKSEILSEIPLLGLRTMNGIDWEYVKNLAKHMQLEDIIQDWEKELDLFVKYGLLTKYKSKIRPTIKGMLLSNTILQTFV